MNKLIIVLSISFIPVLSMAQEETSEKNSSKSEYKTLFNSSGKGEHGGYGAVMGNFTTYEGQATAQVGAKGVWLINHKIGIGLAGFIDLRGVTKQFDLDTAAGLVNPSDSTMGPKSNLNNRYAGLYLEYVISPNSPIHVSIPLIIGGGKATYYNNAEIENTVNSGSSSHTYKEDYEKYVYSSDEYFVIQPGIDLEMNMTKFLRIGVGISYRMFFGLNLIQTEATALDGIATGLTFKFGKF